MTTTSNDNLSVKTWPQIITEVLGNIDYSTKNVLIQAGHFSLLFDEKGSLIPAIKEEIEDIQLKQFIEDSNYMGDFPLATFKSSMPMASACKQAGMNVKFVFIVNDWQWINKGLYNNSPIDRRSFFSKASLPKTYEELLSANSFSLANVITANHFAKEGIYFSEHKLRKIGKKKISVCSPMSCAVEYLPFLYTVLNDYDTLISFIPFSCKIPVLYSAIEYIQSRERNVDIFHIFYNPLTKEKELVFMNKNNLDADYIADIDKQFHIMELLSK